MDKKPDHIEHRSRLRERFKRSGAAGFQDYELLELLLTYAIPRRDVKPAAKRLIKRFGSLAGVLDAEAKELEAIEGLGPASAGLIRLVKEAGTGYLAEKMLRRDLVSSPQAVVDFSRARLGGMANEALMVIYLNAKNEVIDHQVIHEGTVDRAVVYPRRVVEGALAFHAAGLILVHNHPSGHPEPSAEDRQFTRSVGDAARAMDIRMLDHLIVGRQGYYSFAQAGILPA